MIQTSYDSTTNGYMELLNQNKSITVTVIYHECQSGITSNRITDDMMAYS